jgi:hypothetical protein
MFGFGFVGDSVEDSLLPAGLFESLIVIGLIAKDSFLFAMKKIVSFDGVMLFREPLKIQIYPSKFRSQRFFDSEFLNKKFSYEKFKFYFPI